MSDTVRRQRLTRRGELAFLALQVVFWIGVLYFVTPATQSGYHREHLTPTFWMILTVVIFSCLAIVLCLWLLLLAITEAEEVMRSGDELQISYVHLGRQLFIVRAGEIRKWRVRLFRFHMDYNFEPAWLVVLGGFRLLTITRASAGSSL